jgi:hypothetical protein
MEIMIVETIQMKIRYIVHKGHAHKIVLDALTIAAFQQLGIVMEMMTVEMEQMNHRNTARARDVPVLEICLHVIMETVFHEFTFVTEITTVWIIAMKIADMSVVSTDVN